MNHYLVLVQDLITRNQRTIEITARDCVQVDEICYWRGLLALSIELA